jgi:hypothetical protein
MHRVCCCRTNSSEASNDLAAAGRQLQLLTGACTQPSGNVQGNTSAHIGLSGSISSDTVSGIALITIRTLQIPAGPHAFEAPELPIWANAFAHDQHAAWALKKVNHREAIKHHICNA